MRSEWILPGVFNYSCFRILCLFLFLTSSINAEIDSEKTKVVLVLYSDRAIPAVAIFDDSMQRTLRSNYEGAFDYYVEYLDLERFSDTHDDSAIINFLRDRYQDHPPDVIVAERIPALKLLLKHRETLFPGTPIVHTVLTTREVQQNSFPADVVGTPVNWDPTPILELAFQMHPDRRRLTIVTGTLPFDKRWDAALRHWASVNDTGRSVEFLSGLPLEEVASHLAKLGKEDIVFTPGIMGDGSGKTFNGEHSLNIVSKNANAPIYGAFENHVGNGCTGGLITTYESMAEKAADSVIKILQGIPPSEIEQEEMLPRVACFDWRMVRRWEIPEERIPPDSIIRYREPTFWEAYRWHVLGMIAVLIAESLLIAGLLIQRRHRMRVQRSLDERLAFEHMVSECSTAFVNMPDAQIESHIEETMKATARLLEFDGARLSFKTQRGIEIRLTANPDAEDNAAIEALSNPDRFPWSSQRLQQGHDVYFCTLDELPREANADRLAFEKLSIHSLCSIPLSSEGSAFGVFTLFNRSRKMTTNAELLKRHRMVGNLILNALIRREAQQSIEASERAMSLAADAAKLVYWIWNIPTDEIWATTKGRELYGLISDERIDFQQFLETVVQEDRESLLVAVQESISNGTDFECEYQINTPQNVRRWIVARGRVEFDDQQHPRRMRGVSIDVTRRKKAEEESSQLRSEFAHQLRVNTLGELSGALAHELSQPLAAILANAEAAEILLSLPNPDINEIRSILSDIRQDDSRAGEIIHGIRSFLRREEPKISCLNVSKLIEESIRLIRPVATLLDVEVKTEVMENLPIVRGDQIQLLQVVLNLAVNGMDAMRESPPENRLLILQARLINPQTVEVAVVDRGHGIKQDDVEQVFSPFVSTKPNGLGLGLPICRKIVESHGGSLKLRNNSEGGVTGYFVLSIM